MRVIVAFRLFASFQLLYLEIKCSASCAMTTLTKQLHIEPISVSTTFINSMCAMNIYFITVGEFDYRFLVHSLSSIKFPSPIIYKLNADSGRYFLVPISNLLLPSYA